MIILAIINFVVLSLLTKLGQNLFMKITGASMLFFDGKKRIITLVVISVVLAVNGI